MEGSTLKWQEASNETGVSWHTILRARSNVLSLWRPWVAERGCSGREQALSVSHRTGGFCVLPDEKPRVCAKLEVNIYPNLPKSDAVNAQAVPSFSEKSAFIYRLSPFPMV